MTTRHEIIMQALLTQLQDRLPNLQRNIELPERVGTGLQILRDGETVLETPMMPGDGGMFQHTADLELLVEGVVPAVQDAALAAMVREAGLALAADKTLGGLIDYLVLLPVDFINGDIDTGSTVKAALLPIQITYYADSVEA